MPKSILVERDVVIPMRDGIKLLGDIYQSPDKKPKPVLLARTPYGKGFSENGFALFAAEQGYAVVLQDTRGRWASEGDGYPFIHEKQDGYDTLEWLSNQHWCSGQVGMFGMSYLGYTQYAAASTQHHALKAIIPNVTFTDPFSLFFPGGTFALGVAMSWSLLASAQMAITREPLTETQKASLWERFTKSVNNLSSRVLFERLPLDNTPLIGSEGIAPYFSDFSIKRDNPEFWAKMTCPLHTIRVPTLHIGGWYDIFTQQTLDNYSRLIELRTAPQKLIIGPWMHGSFEGLAGEVDFGIQSWGLMVLPEEIQIRWFDHWLKEETNGILDEPPVRIFVMGDNQWRDEYEWPLKRTEYVPYYLHSDGKANSLNGDGNLSPDSPVEEPFDTFIYDPNRPVPTRGGGLCCWKPALPPGAFDQRPVETRSDVLVYTSPILEKDLEVTGPLIANLWVSSTAVDTDFTAKLVDVEQDGYARNIQDGIQRTRYIAQDRETLIRNGEIIRLSINMAATSNVFKAGHRIRIEISSSNFPRFNRNPNTGATGIEHIELQTALQTVFHNANYPSHILLPTISR